MANLIARITAWALTLKPVRAFLLYSEHHGPMLADSVTYRALFSIFAGVLLGFSIAAFSLAGNPAALEALVAAVDAAIPGLVGEDGIIDPSTIALPAGLTLATVLAIIGLVGAAIGAIGSLRTAFRALADKLTDDLFWIWVLVRNLVIAIGIGAAFAASAVITFYANAGIGALSEWLGRSEDDPLSVIRHPCGVDASSCSCWMPPPSPFCSAPSRVCGRRSARCCPAPSTARSDSPCCNSFRACSSGERHPIHCSRRSHR